MQGSMLALVKHSFLPRGCNTSMRKEYKKDHYGIFILSFKPSLSRKLIIPD
jgi:hypothetical protein